MKKLTIIVFVALVPAIFILSKCNNSTVQENKVKKDTARTATLFHGSGNIPGSENMAFLPEKYFFFKSL